MCVVVVSELPVSECFSFSLNTLLSDVAHINQSLQEEVSYCFLSLPRVCVCMLRGCMRTCMCAQACMHLSVIC